MNVVPLGRVSGDISGGLRRLADRIDAGKFPDLKFVAALTVTHNAAFTVFAFGPCSPLETLGALARAVARDLADDER